MARPDYQQKLLGMILAELGDKSDDAHILDAVRTVMFGNKTLWYGVNRGYLQRALFPAAREMALRRKASAEKNRVGQARRPTLVLTS